jgi:signal transduction histidine kinase
LTSNEAGRRKRTPRRPWRLRTRLALALLAVLIPISALLAYSHFQELQDRRESRIESFEAISETVAASMDGFARDLESFTLSTSITLGQVAGTTPFEQETGGPYFQRLLESYGMLRAIFLTDLDGKVVISSGGDNSGFDLADRGYIKALQSGRESVWSEGFPGLQTGQTTLTHGRVIKGLDGRPYYFLIVAFYPEQLKSRLPQDLPKDANIVLADESGTVLYSSPEGAGRPNISDSPVFQRARAGEKVLLRAEPSPVLSDKRYGAYVPVGRNNWVVGFTRPASVVDGPLESRFRRDMVIVLALMAGGYIAILVLTSRLSRPLHTLARAATALANGEKPLAPMAFADADVRTLETALDTMSQAVAEREGRLKAQAQVLETLENVGEALATELDFEKAVAAVARAALELSQSDAAVFFYRSPEDGEELACLSLIAPGGHESAYDPIKPDDPLLKMTLQGEVLQAQDVMFMPGQVRDRWINGEDSPAVRSLLGVPVIPRSGEVEGALLLLHRKQAWFTEDHVRMATGLARRCSVILENARLYSAAREVQDELRRANVAKDEFIGVMSHELRTPITTIYGGARLLHTRRRHLDEEDVEEMIASIEEEAERLFRLVENLLALARIDLGEILAQDPIAVGPAVEQSVKQFAGRHPSRPLELHITPDLPPAKGETTYIHQIVHNLVTNADKYSEAGLPIEVEVSRQGDEIVVSILDHGRGVPPDEMDQIFESFYRSQRTARDARGKGLGLTVCKRLTEVMGGRIWAKNRDEGGLEVAFTLGVVHEFDADDVAAEPVKAARET